MNSETINDQRVNDNLNDSLPPTTEEIDNEGTNFGRESKIPRGTTSKVWDHFTKNGIKEGKEKAKCNACGAKYVSTTYHLLFIYIYIYIYYIYILILIIITII